MDCIVAVRTIRLIILFVSVEAYQILTFLCLEDATAIPTDESTNFSRDITVINDPHSDISLLTIDALV